MLTVLTLTKDSLRKEIMQYHVLTFKLTQGFSLPLESQNNPYISENYLKPIPIAEDCVLQLSKHYSLLLVKTLEKILEKFAQAILELIRNGLNLKLIRLQRLKKYNILQYKTENEIEKLKKSVKFYTKIHIYTSMYRNSRFKQIIFSKYTTNIKTKISQREVILILVCSNYNFISFIFVLNR